MTTISGPISRAVGIAAVTLMLVAASFSTASLPSAHATRPAVAGDRAEKAQQGDKHHPHKGHGHKGHSGSGSKVQRLLKVAASKAGSPYGYGASGPNRFDCSGFTMWVFRHVGTGLPRTSSAQRGAVRRIPAGQRHRGDLVFFHSGSGVYHVGIYAGGGAIWHAPYSGQVVRRERIWTSSVSYGRARL